MDTQDSSVVDVPHMKLAKVGKGRERKRGGAGWLNGARSGSGFSGALGGAGAGGGLGGFMGTGMSLAKLLMVLLVSGGISAGAWEIGSHLAANSASDGKAAAPKLFADKDSQKYADTSGVIKAENSIPNSLGYINNDGMTAEQRAAKKAADDAAAAAAAKAAADAQAKADADAKAKADADAKAAATADASAPGGAKDVPKMGLGSGKFGSFSSGFGSSGGLSGGAGLSGGIARNFGGMDGLGGKGQKGGLGAFSGANKVATIKAPMPSARRSTAKGFLAPLQSVANQSNAARAAGSNEAASAGASQPFDNNAGKGTAISGPGLGNGTQTGPSDGGGSLNPGGGSGGGPISSPGNCANGQTIDSSGNCQNINTPNGVNGAPYQGLIDAVLALMTIVTILLIMAKFFSDSTIMKEYAAVICMIVAALGAVIAGMGVMIAAMTHGDFMIGGIVALVGAYVSYSAFKVLGNAGDAGPIDAGDMESMAAKPLIAAAVGELALGSSAAKSMMGG